MVSTGNTMVLNHIKYHYIKTHFICSPQKTPTTPKLPNKTINKKTPQRTTKNKPTNKTQTKVNFKGENWCKAMYKYSEQTEKTSETDCMEVLHEFF